MAAAIVLTDWFADELARVQVLVAETAEQAQARRLDAQFTRLAARHEGRVTVREVQRANARKYPSAASARAAVEAAVASGLWRWDAGGLYIERVRRSDAPTEADPSAADGGSDAGPRPREKPRETASSPSLSDSLTRWPDPPPRPGAARPAARPSENRPEPRLFPPGDQMLPD